MPIIVHAFVLAFRARRRSDQTAINRFAADLTPALVPWLERIQTPVIAFCVVRRGAEATSVDGPLVGVAAGLISLGVTLAFGGSLAMSTAAVVAILTGLA